jgi:hypothetical protein
MIESPAEFRTRRQSVGKVYYIGNGGSRPLMAGFA